jgi:hypothetical protein
MMDHSLRTISYIADIGDLVVIMARRRLLPQVLMKVLSYVRFSYHYWFNSYSRHIGWAALM